jgi:hypothetical protein
VIAKTLSFVACLSVLTACANTPAAPTAESITLQSIVPAPGTALVAGERVTFTAVVTCTIVNAAGGFTALVLQDQRNVSLLDPDGRAPEASLRKGTATVTLSQTITVPASGMTVNALFPLFIDGRDSTQAVVARSYTVR